MLMAMTRSQWVLVGFCVLFLVAGTPCRDIPNYLLDANGLLAPLEEANADVPKRCRPWECMLAC
jgi:hypothetical protein